MNRRTFLIASMALNAPASISATEDAWPSRKLLGDIFRETMESFRRWQPKNFATLPPEIEKDDWIGPRRPAGVEGEDNLWVTSPLEEDDNFGIVQISKSGRITAAGAHVRKLFFGLDATPLRHVPRWTMTQALENAQNALRHFRWDIPRDMELTRVHYSLSGSWELDWNRVFDGVPEVKNEEDIDKISVIIDEEGNGLRLTRWYKGSAPETTIPKISRTDAVAIAMQALPKIISSDSFSNWMPKNLSPIDLRRVELCCTIPNWLQINNNAEKEKEEYPKKRYLCWKSSFLLYHRIAMAGADGGPAPSYGLVSVFTNALSGENVGVDFEPIANDGENK